jgi:hypothetical protein
MLLNLNVSQLYEATQAHQELSHAAKVLTPQALKMPLPNAMDREILAATPWQSKVKNTTSALTSYKWSTGKRYDLKSLVRPMGQTH